MYVSEGSEGHLKGLWLEWVTSFFPFLSSLCDMSAAEGDLSTQVASYSYPASKLQNIVGVRCRV